MNYLTGLLAKFWSKMGLLRRSQKVGRLLVDPEEKQGHTTSWYSDYGNFALNFLIINMETIGAFPQINPC